VTLRREWICKNTWWSYNCAKTCSVT